MDSTWRYLELISKNCQSAGNDHAFGFVSRMCGYRPISQTRNVDVVGNTQDEYGNIVDSEY